MLLKKRPPLLIRGGCLLINQGTSDLIGISDGFEMGRCPLEIPHLEMSAAYSSEQNSTFSPARIILVVRTAHILPHIEQV